MLFLLFFFFVWPLSSWITGSSLLLFLLFFFFVCSLSSWITGSSLALLCFLFLLLFWGANSLEPISSCTVDFLLWCFLFFLISLSWSAGSSLVLILFSVCIIAESFSSWFLVSPPTVSSWIAGSELLLCFLFFLSCCAESLSCVACCLGSCIECFFSCLFEDLLAVAPFSSSCALLFASCLFFGSLFYSSSFFLFVFDDL